MGLQFSNCYVIYEQVGGLFMLQRHVIFFHSRCNTLSRILVSGALLLLSGYSDYDQRFQVLAMVSSRVETPQCQESPPYVSLIKCFGIFVLYFITSRLNLCFQDDNHGPWSMVMEIKSNIYKIGSKPRVPYPSNCRYRGKVLI